MLVVELYLTPLRRIDILIYISMVLRMRRQQARLYFGHCTGSEIIGNGFSAVPQSTPDSSAVEIVPSERLMPASTRISVTSNEMPIGAHYGMKGCLVCVRIHVRTSVKQHFDRLRRTIVRRDNEACASLLSTKRKTVSCRYYVSVEMHYLALTP